MNKEASGKLNWHDMIDYTNQKLLEVLAPTSQMERNVSVLEWFDLAWYNPFRYSLAVEATKLENLVRVYVPHYRPVRPRGRENIPNWYAPCAVFPHA